MNINRYKKENIYSQLKLAIVTQQLRAGQVITEEEISRQYSISRTPVREIFRRLENDGLVKNIPFRGTYISDLKNEDIEEILEIRFALESFAARIAAEKADDEIKNQLSELEKQFELAVKTQDNTLAFDTDTKLHELILNISGNKRIQTIITNLLGQIHRIRFISCHMEGRIETTVKEHLEIIKTIKENDPDRAEEKMKIHINNTKIILLKSSKIEEEFTSFLYKYGINE